VKTDVTIYGTTRLQLATPSPGAGAAAAISTDGANGLGAATAQGHITMAYPINTIWMAPTGTGQATDTTRRAPSTDPHKDPYAIGYSRHPHGGRGLKHNKGKKGDYDKCHE